LQDIRWRTFWFFLIQLFLYLIISNIFNTKIATITLISFLTLFIAVHIFWLNKLIEWLNYPSAATIPDGTGIWQMIFSKVYNNFRNQKKSKKDLTEVIEQFIGAADALLDGVVTLTNANEIIWSNKRAQTMFGINQTKDVNKPINYIFRNSKFIEFIEGENYDQSIKVMSKNKTQNLEIRIIPFGKFQKLLVAEDISSLLKNEMFRKDFVSNFSHELKTPLTVITGFLETLSSNGAKLDSNTNKIFKLMNDQAIRMKSLLDDLLLLSNVEASLNINRSQEIKIKLLLEKIKLNILSIDNKEHKIIFKINNKLNLYGSRSEIESAFTNLIVNAIRYTPKDGQILINWGLINDIPTFEVTDTGIGMAKKHMNRITERFYRVDDARSRSSGGTGLGLSIVKNILLKHQADLKISSEINNGSTFKIIFPNDRLINN